MVEEAATDGTTQVLVQLGKESVAAREAFVKVAAGEAQEIGTFEIILKKGQDEAARLFRAFGQGNVKSGGSPVTFPRGQHPTGIFY